MQPISYQTEAFGDDAGQEGVVFPRAVLKVPDRVKSYVRRQGSGGRRQKAAHLLGGLGDSYGLKRYVTLGPRARISCLPGQLRGLVKQVSTHFGRKVVINSGHRSSSRNRRVGGVKNSYHLTCRAVDMRIPGISRNRLAAYVRSLPGRGGVGTYCGKSIVHLDIGARRSWNYHCRGFRKGRFAGK